MIRKDASRLALFVAAIAAAGAMGAGRAVADMRVVSSDFTSRFLAIGVSKSIVVELSADVKSVVVADRTIATAVALSKRRVEIIGAGLGQTNSTIMTGRSADSMSRSRTRRNRTAWRTIPTRPAWSWWCMAEPAPSPLCR